MKFRWVVLVAVLLAPSCCASDTNSESVSVTSASTAAPSLVHGGESDATGNAFEVLGETVVLLSLIHI